MRYVTVMAGDILTGVWNVFHLDGKAGDEWGTNEQTPGATTMVKGKNRIRLDHMIDNIEIVTEDKVKKFGGTVGMGILGGLALGPLGAIGGLLVGGNKKEVCFVCQFKDGKKFLGKTDGKTYQKLMALSFNKT